MNGAFRRNAFQKAGFFSDRKDFSDDFLGIWKNTNSERDELSIRIKKHRLGLRYQSVPTLR